MKLEEAMIAMREGKTVKRKHWASSKLSIIQIIVYNHDQFCTNVELDQHDLIAEDWEVVNG